MLHPGVEGRERSDPFGPGCETSCGAFHRPHTLETRSENLKRQRARDQ